MALTHMHLAVWLAVLANALSAHPQATVKPNTAAGLAQPDEILLREMPVKTAQLFRSRYYAPRGPGAYLLSPDKRRLFWVEDTQAGHLSYLDGKAFPSPYARAFGIPAQGIRPDPSAVFSADGNHLLAIAEKRDPRGFVAILDGQEWPESYRDIERYGFIGASGNAFVIAKTGPAFVLIINGKRRSADYEQILAPCATSDLARLGFVAKKSKKNILVVDGTELTTYEDFRSPVFSPDGRHFAFAGYREKNWHLVADGAEQPEAYDGIEDLSYSPDSKRLIACVQIGRSRDSRSTKYAYLIDGRLQGGYDALAPITYSPTLVHYAYIGLTYDYKFRAITAKASFVVDGKVIREDARAGSGDYTFGLVQHTTEWAVGALLRSTMGAPTGLLGEEYDSPAGLRPRTLFESDAQYHVISNDSGVLLYDDKRRPEGLKPLACLVSQDNRHMGCVAKRQSGLVDLLDLTIRGEVPGAKDLLWIERPKGVGITYKTASFPVVSISPDGARLAYGVAIGRSDMGVAVDGKVQQEKGAFEISDLQFSPDGRHLVYRVRASSGHFVVINGQAGKKYDIVIPESLSFPERDTLMFFAVAGSRLLRVRYALH